MHISVMNKETCLKKCFNTNDKRHLGTYTEDMEQNKFFVLFVIITSSLKSVVCACTFPTELQNSDWTYVERNLVVTFGNDTLTGLQFNAFGTFIDAFTCISSLNNVIVFKSDTSYTDFGNTRYIYVCMKYTKVSDDLFYFYLLSDKNTNIFPNSPRVYTPIPPDDNNPTCTFCQYNDAPQDSEAQSLQRQGTSETLPNGISACLPCEKECTATTSTTSSTTTMATSPTTTPSTATTVTPRSCEEGNGKCICRSHICNTVVLDLKCRCSSRICCQNP